MIFYLTFLLFMLSLPSLAALLLKRKIEFFLLPHLALTGLLLFVFLRIDLLKQGFYFCCLLAVISWIAFAVISFFKKNEFKKILKEFILTSGLAFFVISTMLYFYWNTGNRFHEGDDLSCWGILPKLMYYFNHQTFEYPQLSRFYSYPPGLHLMQYLFCNLNGSYAEDVALFAIGTFSISGLSLFFVPLKRGNYFVKVLFGIAVFVFPLLFFNTYYVGFSDIPFSVLFCAIPLFFIFEYRQKPYLAGCLLLVTLPFLYLIRQAGFALAIIVAFGVIAVAVAEKCTSDFKDTKSWKRLLWQFIFCIAALGVTYFIKFEWNVMLQAAKIKKQFNDAPITISVIYDCINGLNPVFNKIFEAIRHRFFFAEARNFCGISLSEFAIILLTTGSVFFITAKSDKKQRVLLRTFAIFLSLGEIAYTAGMIFYYRFTFSYGEATKLASFRRYLVPFPLTLFVLLFMSLLLRKMKSKTAGRTLSAIAILILCSTFSAKITINTDRANHKLPRLEHLMLTEHGLEKNTSSYFRDIETGSRMLIPPGKKIAVITNAKQSYGRDENLLRMKLLDKFGNIILTGSKNLFTNPDNFIKGCSGCDYIYHVGTINEIPKNVIGQFIAGGSENLFPYRFYRRTAANKFELVQPDKYLFEIEERKSPFLLSATQRYNYSAVAEMSNDFAAVGKKSLKLKIPFDNAAALKMPKYFDNYGNAAKISFFLKGNPKVQCSVMADKKVIWKTAPAWDGWKNVEVTLPSGIPTKDIALNFFVPSKTKSENIYLDDVTIYFAGQEKIDIVK